MAIRGWSGGGVDPTLVHAYLDLSRDASTTTAGATALASHSNDNRKGCPPDSAHEVPRSKAMCTAGMVRALGHSVNAVRSSVVAKTRSYFGQPSSLTAPSSSRVSAETQQQQPRRRSSFHCHRRHQSQQQHQQKRRDGGDGAKVRTCADYGAAWKCCPSTWMPAVCAGVVAVLCYMNSLDGDFVHDDMVAVVGNPDVTGESRRHASSSSLWINDFWGRPMADPRSHKSYRPLTVLTFSAFEYFPKNIFRKQDSDIAVSTVTSATEFVTDNID
ncbi:hypothetical protein HPB50_021270 [Hyalomma asiaticum]|uniref:Uncharacterized protein n=1 Tax=Hyalomma asiaticum TaxID=266040 RepID=A0ACB7TQZ3_HYAAI|nr:hypothetical protein HPB50_021270 [Hyalomma asiaticum]